MMPEVWACYEGFRLLYALTLVGFANYSNIFLSGTGIHLVFRVTVAEYTVFCVMSYISFQFCGRSCTASGELGGIEDRGPDELLLLLLQGVLDFVQDVSFFETDSGFTFEII